MSTLTMTTAGEIKTGDRIYLHGEFRAVLWVHRHRTDDELLHVCTVGMGAEIVDERHIWAPVEVMR